MRKSSIVATLCLAMVCAVPASEAAAATLHTTSPYVCQVNASGNTVCYGESVQYNLVQTGARFVYTGKAYLVGSTTTPTTSFNWTHETRFTVINTGASVFRIDDTFVITEAGITCTYSGRGVTVNQQIRMSESAVDCT